MLTAINPKLPMRNKTLTKEYYIIQLNFNLVAEYDEYLIIERDKIEIHFFEFKALNPQENYGQVYIRTNDIDSLYQLLLEKDVAIHPNGYLQVKLWGQKEFAILDPDNNLLTFGQHIG